MNIILPSKSGHKKLTSADQQGAGFATGINNKGYVGTGDSVSYFKDFWEYDPATDIWTKKSSLGGTNV